MLTERTIREAKGQTDAEGKSQAYTIWDRRVMGLGLQITPNGVKNYVIRYRVGGQKRQAILARAGQISLRGARLRAGAELVRIRAGETDPLERERQVREAPTFADLWEHFKTVYAPERMAIQRLTAGTLHEYDHQAKRYLLPALKKRRVRDVTRADIERLVQRMTKTPSQRNRTLALASRLFTLSEHLGWRPQHTNPVRGILRAREDARDRVFSDVELAALGKALNNLADRYPAATSAIKFIAVTGWRASEAAGLQWSNITDFERGRVTLPTKTGQQTRMLPSVAIQLLSTVPHVNNCDAIFTMTGRNPIRYKHLREVFLLACSHSGIKGGRLHDCRRTAATNAAASGISLPVLRDLLGHRTVAMSARYARMADSAVAAAVEQTGEGIAAAMRGKPKATVVPIRRTWRHG